MQRDEKYSVVAWQRRGKTISRFGYAGCTYVSDADMMMEVRGVLSPSKRGIPPVRIFSLEVSSRVRWLLVLDQRLCSACHLMYFVSWLLGVMY